MKNKTHAVILLAIFLTPIACTISYEGVNFGSDPEVDFIEDQTATAGAAQSAAAPQAASTPEPAFQPAAPQGSSAEGSQAGTHEYSVAATDFECICQVDGNVTVEFNFKGDQLEIVNPGGATDVYQKIANNTYKRTFMGYYILSSGSGDDVTETKVEEERHTVIILNNNGYVMEHYQGEASSPCCFHTFTKVQ